MREHTVGGREAYFKSTNQSSPVGVVPHNSSFCQDKLQDTHIPPHCGPPQPLLELIVLQNHTSS